jgi:putative membrane protein
MTKTTMLGVAIATALMCSAAGTWAQGTQSARGAQSGQGMQAAQSKPDKAAQAFITKAVQGNLAEVQMGQLAQQQGSSDQVKNFGQQLVSDHTSANQKATSVAGQLGVTPPNEPNKKQKSDYDKMSKMSGAAFDRQFAKMMVADHKKDIAEYKKASKMKNDAVAGYATDSLPVLEKHLQIAQDLNKSAGKGGASGGKGSSRPAM